MAIDVTEWCAESLIKSVRRRAYMPTNDASFSDQDVLDVINEELRNYIVPTLRRVNEEHLITRYAFSSVVGQDWYKLPPRCSGEAVKLIEWLSDGVSTWVPVERLEPEKAVKIGSGYWLEDDRVYLYPSPAVVAQYRIRYFYRPSKVVLSSRYTTVTSIPLNQLGIASEAPFIAYDGTTLVFDVVDGQPGFRLLWADATGTLSATVISATSLDATATGVTYGDFVCYPGEAPMPQTPDACWPLLAQRVAVKLLEGRGGTNYGTAKAALTEETALCIDALKPRVQAGSRYVHNFNAPGWKFRGRPRSIR